ncbi:Aste57867_12737 [Aphanomyces stellatus]|uniref:Aste57867_12737 protein n=1 Tax=Aphanomyces stellatus TaxID=120398 RepID=A0A485KWQ9_9STRA|nr:hypothetical protein As57867_012689 [Aphanomyces stellatus]VFT89587.1 Aste57867_12737 [Aphanomyces stellatus]
MLRHLFLASFVAAVVLGTPNDASCIQVSVVGDATYCVPGPICGDEGDTCPKKGDVAAANCVSNIKSFEGNGRCVAPADATCQEIPSGARGCVFSAASPDTPPKPPTTTIALTTTTLPPPVSSVAPTTTMAAVPKKDCTDVSVEGDATYCVSGSICGDEGDSCPKKGDVAVADCISTLKSFVSNGQCIAPADATCQKIKTGARGCVFASKAEVTTTTAAPVAKTTFGPAITTTRIPTTTTTNAPKAKDCTDVSVEGDATYCVSGSICGDEGDSCPKKGDVAVADCISTLKSFVSNGQCIAPADATCQKIKTGARGCVFASKTEVQTTTTTPLVKTTFGPAITTTRAPTTTKVPKAKDCTDVSVEGDATYCVSGRICGDEGDSCPKKGDVAVADCISTLKSFVSHGQCTAPADATCQKIKTGARGCVFASKAEVTTTTAAPVAKTTFGPAITTTRTPTTTTTNAPKAKDCTDVSVEGDATYCVSGRICGDEGDSCPKKGDVAVADCISTLKSFVSHGQCTAPADATCQKIKTGARGCVFSKVVGKPTTRPPSTTPKPSQTGQPTNRPNGTGTNATNTTQVDDIIRLPPTTTVASVASIRCAENWSQCNGQNWPFGVCCRSDGWSCVYHNEYYSQCLPVTPRS